MKTPAQAASNYKTNGGSATSANLWATNLSADLPAVYDAAVASAPTWQQNVNTPEALANYKSGLAKAKANTGPTIAKINGPSKGTYQAQVSAAGNVGGAYSNFAAQFLPAVAGEVQTLARTNPRGTKADNRARLNAYLDWLDTQAGKFKQ